ncbi:uncharacterized protein LOC126681596 [Mercurialis annua]|uniref:uncharacterized protein LOC126681596 n=1 Tax=Mercurialis annua TaxID=3986 RepID=UPI00215F325F|nr:uncharacterized protein LOC126681596 [Mercurialis annua]
MTALSGSMKKNGKLSISSAYEHFIIHYPVVLWWKVVLNAGYVPKHSFISWLAIKNRLKTKDKLSIWGVTDNDRCMFCNREAETVEHLFFECILSKSIMGKVLHCCLIDRGVYRWRRELSWMSRKAVGKSLLARVRRTAFNCSVYNIWKGRNKSIFGDRRVEET